MKKVTTVVGALIALLVLRWAFIQAVGWDEIDFRGEKIKLNRKYIDYDTYKNDVDNIQDSERLRIERMMTETKIGAKFKDWAALVNETSELKVPGYGSGGGPQVKAVGRKFRVLSFEIPNAKHVEKDRYLVFEEQPDQSLLLVDDFVFEGFLGEGRLVDGQLTYFDGDNGVVRKTKL